MALTEKKPMQLIFFPVNKTTMRVFFPISLPSMYYGITGDSSCAFQTFSSFYTIYLFMYFSQCNILHEKIKRKKPVQSSPRNTGYFLYGIAGKTVERGKKNDGCVYAVCVYIGLHKVAYVHITQPTHTARQYTYFIPKRHTIYPFHIVEGFCAKIYLGLLLCF